MGELSKQLAKHFKDVHYGGNWTLTNYKGELSDVTWQESISKYQDLNTIATLTYHTHYFVNTLIKVLQGGPLEGHDKFSFDHPLISSSEDWENFKSSVFGAADELTELLEVLPDEQVLGDFIDPKYGNWYRNIAGVIEHHHYHLGQIVLIKKLIRIRSNT